MFRSQVTLVTSCSVTSWTTLLRSFSLYSVWMTFPSFFGVTSVYCTNKCIFYSLLEVFRWLEHLLKLNQCRMFLLCVSSVSNSYKEIRLLLITFIFNWFVKENAIVSYRFKDPYLDLLYSSEMFDFWNFVIVFSFWFYNSIYGTSVWKLYN